MEPGYKGLVPYNQVPPYKMPFDKFIILSLLVLISHGLDHKKEQCNKGQRQRREIHTDDVQKVLEAQFLPDGLSPHLYDHFNNIVFETVGYSVAGKAGQRPN